MDIPSFANVKFVNEQGYLTDPWRQILSKLLSELQTKASNEGIVVPTLTTAEIAKLTNSTNGTLVCNGTTNKLMVKLSSGFKDITTS